jgi:hypothetical protein
MSTVLASSRLGRVNQPSPSSSTSNGFEKDGNISVSVDEDIPPLAAPNEEKRFWFQRTKNYEPNAVATQVSHS